MPTHKKLGDLLLCHYIGTTVFFPHFSESKLIDVIDWNILGFRAFKKNLSLYKMTPLSA